MAIACRGFQYQKSMLKSVGPTTRICTAMSFENSLMATVLGFHSSIISFELARRGVWHGAAKASGSGGVGIFTVGLTSVLVRGELLPARRYASAGTSYGPVFVCVCVCLSQVDVLSKRMNESSWFLAWELHSTYPTLCYKEIHVPSKIRVLPSGFLLQTLDLENFATEYRSSKRVSNLALERQTLRP